jgi:hypothetical protein
LIDSALAYWTVDPESNKCQFARTIFLKAKGLEAAGKSQKGSAELKVASRLRFEFTNERRETSSLTTSDFDSLVTHWYQ